MSRKASPGKWGPVDQGSACACGAWRGQLGLEPTPGMFVEHLVEVLREVRRVLRRDGTLWLNLGDSFMTDNRRHRLAAGAGVKPKDLVGVPWRVALALQADGWFLRSEIIWCLSGGTRVYARMRRGTGPMMIKDLARTRGAELWNGNRWTRVLGMSRSARRGDELEIVLRSGERIACTPTHRFPVAGRGLRAASDLRTGDVLETTSLPESESPKDGALDEDAAWLAGLYIAEGSRAGDTIQIAGHAREKSRWERLKRVARKFGGSATCTVDGNTQAARLYGRVLNAIIDEFVVGRVARDKGFAAVVWRYSDRFLAAMVQG